MEQKPPAAPTAETGGGLEEQIAIKKAKVAELRGRGIDPYPARATRVHTAAQALKLGEGLTDKPGTDKVTAAGRLVELRDMGKSIFGRLADQTGRVQVYF